MSGLEITVLALGVIFLGMIAVLVFVAKLAIEGFQALTEIAEDNRRTIGDVALFQAQLGERLAEVEQLTSLIEVRKDDSGVQAVFVEDEKDVNRKVSAVIANNFQTS